jgi:hypothetical protein
LYCDDDAPLYAETTVAAAARARKPGIAVHFRRVVIAATWGERETAEKSARADARPRA